MTVTAEFDAPVERVWQLWDDPRQLERWWGPPTYPATVVDHDLTPGGNVTYFMTGPGGRQAGRLVARCSPSTPPHRLEFEDGFADDAGKPNATCRRTTVVHATERGGRRQDSRLPVARSDGPAPGHGHGGRHGRGDRPDRDDPRRRRDVVGQEGWG